MRQPHARNWASGSAANMPRMNVPSAAPVGAPAFVKDAAKPRFPCVECSSAIRAAPPHSPPTAMPCMTRSSTKTIAPADPMTSLGGISPMSVEATPMMSMERMSIRLRPRRSPKCPKIAPPKGRAM